MITLGGPYPLTMKERPDWIAAEQSLIRQYADHDRRILGICLGAQIVVMLGAAVRREHAELGWHAIQRISGNSTWSTEACRHK